MGLGWVGALGVVHRAHPSGKSEAEVGVGPGCPGGTVESKWAQAGRGESRGTVHSGSPGRIGAAVSVG